MTYTYKVYLRGNAMPIIINSVDEVMTIEQVRLDMAAQDEGRAWSIKTPYGGFMCVRAASVEVVVLEVKP